jgi:hypothetical protein
MSVYAEQNTAPQLESAKPATSSAFFIRRNKNRNEVHYEISLDEQCRPLGDKPVRNYWLRLEDGPEVRKPLSLFQQAGYGFKSQAIEGDHVVVVLRALPERPITFLARRDAQGCVAAAYVDIAGARAHLEHAYVFAEEGLLLPEVKYVELFGSKDDGTPVSEKIEPR